MQVSLTTRTGHQLKGSEGAKFAVADSKDFCDFVCRQFSQGTTKILGLRMP